MLILGAQNGKFLDQDLGRPRIQTKLIRLDCDERHRSHPLRFQGSERKGLGLRAESSWVREFAFFEARVY